MQYTILEVYRHNLYHACFTRAADALFDLADALLTDGAARSLIELSEAACFRRGWPSVYAALQDGRIDRMAVIRVFTEMLPQRMVGTRLVLGLDTSSILRPEAHTAKDRTLVYRSNLPAAATPVGPGWSFSALVVVPNPVSSWTYILDHRRVPRTETATTIGVAQLQAVLPKLPAGGQRPVLLLDRRYSNAPWVMASATLPTDQLIRARADQVLYRPAPAPTGTRGAPRKDGARFQGSELTTHGPPDAEWTGVDAKAQTVQVRCWAGVHGRKARTVTLTAVRIIRTGARGTKRAPREARFWWLGGALPSLAELAERYPRRFGQEHGYRFDKQDLLWAAPRVRTPEQMERWTDLVAIVHTTLVLARPRVDAERRPWEARHRPPTPRQVRRGRLLRNLGHRPGRPNHAEKHPGGRREQGSSGRSAMR